MDMESTIVAELVRMAGREALTIVMALCCCWAVTPARCQDTTRPSAAKPADGTGAAGNSVSAGGATQSADEAGQTDDNARSLLSDEALSFWAKELESPQYSVRSAATDRLMDLTPEQLPKFVALFLEGSLESIQRGALVLQHLALSGSDAQQRAARQILGELSRSGPSLLAQRARESLDAVAREKRQRAIVKLTAAGAQYHNDSNSVPEFMVRAQPLPTIRFGRTWRGDLPMLELLSCVQEVERVVLEGPQIDDRWIPYIAQLPRLRTLTIRKASLTDEGLVPLQNAASLRSLEIYYTDLTNSSVPTLGKLKLEVLTMFGNKLTKDQKDVLSDAIPTAKVDLRPGGAFLGVGPPQQGENGDGLRGCHVYVVLPKSGAERAGIQRQDIIVKYNGTEVNNFLQMTELIGRQRPGDVVPIQVLRDGQPLVVEATLGEWSEK
ncbi:MAG: PDZ domain-containing protein [Planctomycetota bacterium]|nr:PDZ domain-containing protein [Planctomycetota bacterium]